MTAMKMTSDQKALQIADDLDEQASELNSFISNPQNTKRQREDAVEKQLDLRRAAARLRVQLMTEIVGEGAPVIDDVVAAADRAKTAAKRIEKIKGALDLAAATITFFAALSTGQLDTVAKAWGKFTAAIAKAESAG